MKKRKPLRLHVIVYTIIIGLLFSVIGVVVIYLNGIQTRESQYDAFQQAAQEAAAPIQVAPIPLEAGIEADTTDPTEEGENDEAGEEAALILPEGEEAGEADGIIPDVPNEDTDGASENPEEPTEEVVIE